MANRLAPAAEVAQRMKHPARSASESYLRARTALLAEEIELRRHTEYDCCDGIRAATVEATTSDGIAREMRGSR